MAISYFDNFGDVIINDVKFKNLYNRITISILKQGDLYLEYTINDEDTPETIALNYYGDKRFFWVIMLANNMKDYFYDFPLTHEELLLYVDKLWIDEYLPHIYDTGFITTKEEVFEELQRQNELKKVIKVLNPKYLQDLLYQIELLNKKGYI